MDRSLAVPYRFDVNQTLRRLVRRLQPDPAASGIAFVFDSSPDLPSVQIDGAQIREVFRALLQRSRRAALIHQGPNAKVTLETRMSSEAIQIRIKEDTPVDPLSGLSAFADETGCCLTLTQCAEVIHDQGGKMWAWKPRCSGTTTVLIELPIG